MKTTQRRATTKQGRKFRSAQYGGNVPAPASGNGHEPACEAALVKRINRTLAGRGLKVALAQRAAAPGVAGGYEIRFESRLFPLRVSIDELASALGVQVESTAADRHTAALAARGCGCGRRYH